MFDACKILRESQKYSPTFDFLRPTFIILRQTTVLMKNMVVKPKRVLSKNWHFGKNALY
jgi:hypothetical protein